MGITLVIRASTEQTFNNGQVGYSDKWLDQITALFPDFTSLKSEAIDSAIGIFARKEDDDRCAKKLKIQSFQKTSAGVLVRFSIESELEITSGDLRRRVWGHLRKAGLIQEGQYLPFCCVLNTEIVAAMLSDKPIGGTLAGELGQMQQRNDWIGIYNRFQPIESISQNYPDVWNNPGILSTIGFACGKLAETSSIPRDMFQDEKRRQAFLKQQAKYRYETEVLRKRCVELMPNNPGYWSSLGYLHYLNAHELNQPRGRRDGNIREEIEKALEYFEKALSLDSSRITDHYRKGYLLAEILPQQILFGKQSYGAENRVELARQKIQEGIASFSQAIQIWESLNPTDEKQNEKRKRYRKNYIKSLYHTGCAYYQLIYRDWDEAVYALGLRENITERDNLSFIPQDLQNANNAWRHFYSCWVADRVDGLMSSEEPSVTTTSRDGEMEGVHKLYRLGKVSFVRYWILSGYGQKDTPQAIENRNKAESYLLAALDFAWSPEKQRQKKDFVAELLARVYISKGEYTKAIEVIKKHRGRSLDPYIAHTAAVALMLSGKYAEAQQTLTEALQDRGNKAIWTTQFLKGCAYLREGALDKAQQAFTKADIEARKHGKETLDTWIIGQAFVSYKSDNVQEAIEFLKRAVEVNPYRLSVHRRLQSWQRDVNTKANSPSILPDNRSNKLSA